MLKSDPDIKRYSCVKGANMVSGAAGDPCGRFPLPCPLGHGDFSFKEEINMETRVAVMSIIVENGEAVERLNAILHAYG